MYIYIRTSYIYTCLFVYIHIYMSIYIYIHGCAHVDTSFLVGPRLLRPREGNLNTLVVANLSWKECATTPAPQELSGFPSTLRRSEKEGHRLSKWQFDVSSGKCEYSCASIMRVPNHHMLECMYMHILILFVLLYPTHNDSIIISVV